jgi:MFS transporter, FHS family, glucose/mannose:H+ symporter
MTRSAVPREPLFASACGGIFVFGIVLALLGTLAGLPEIRVRFGLEQDLAAQGNLFLLLFLGIFAATVVVGPLIDRFGTRAVLVSSSGLVAAALGGFIAADSFGAAGLSAVVLGLGGGGLNTATNVLVSDLFDESRGPRLNVLGVFFGIGALFVPLTAAGLSQRIGTTPLLAAGAALAVACLLAYATLRFPPAVEAEGFSFAQVAEVVRYPGVLLFASLLFFQSGNEASIGGWTSTYVGHMGRDPATATWVLAGYWGALMIGRLLSARLLAVVSKPRLVLLSGVGSAFGAVLLLMAESLAAMAAGVALMGLSFASVYPTTLGMVGDRYRRFTGTVFGVLFSIALMGGMLFPWLIGHVSQAMGVRSGMVVPLVGAAMICLLVTIITARHPEGRGRVI